MRTNWMRYIVALLILGALSFFTACVPARKLEESEAKRKTIEEELTRLKKSCSETDEKYTALTKEMVENKSRIAGLVKDTNITGTSFRNLTAKYDKLNSLNEQLLERYNKLLSGSKDEQGKLSTALQSTQDQLFKRQDELAKTSAELDAKKKDLEKLSDELKKREAKVLELESALKQKDEASAALKKKLSDALYNFENKGLTITQKDGKVYVSMDESLLFASGKTAVEPKGIEALKNVAKVLEQNADINIMIEGHTDDVPMKGLGDVKDNWDLSVMRATSVTKILLSSAKIDAKRIIASGRGEYLPLDASKTTEGRKKNRRTEIILTPKLDELLKVLGQ
jgi:chemotaxis protein MotB